MSAHDTRRDDAKDKAVATLHQLATVAVEHAELARTIGMPGQGGMEDRLARYWRLLANSVREGLIDRLIAAEEEPPF